MKIRTAKKESFNVLTSKPSKTLHGDCPTNESMINTSIFFSDCVCIGAQIPPARFASAVQPAPNCPQRSRHLNERWSARILLTLDGAAHTTSTPFAAANLLNIRGGIVASIYACYAEDAGSIPRGEVHAVPMHLKTRHYQIAHAGSRTRVTSMGPCMMPLHYVRADGLQPVA